MVNRAKRMNEKVRRHADGSVERWRDVPEWEGLYRVSDRGRVKSLGRWCRGVKNRMRWVSGRMLKLGVTPSGHRQVSLCKSGFGCRTYKVAALVLMAFVRLPKEGEMSLHADDVPSNNNLANLRWGTRMDNIADEIRNRGKRCNAKLTKEEQNEVIDLIREGKVRIGKIAEMYSVHQSAISWIKRYYCKDLPDGRRFSRRQDRRKSDDPWNCP